MPGHCRGFAARGKKIDAEKRIYDCALREPRMILLHYNSFKKKFNAFLSMDRRDETGFTYFGLLEPIATMVTVRSPAGRLMVISSSTLRPESALPTGESTLILPRLTSNSSGPTNW